MSNDRRKLYSNTYAKYALVLIVDYFINLYESRPK